jgi:hypothetical protein
MRNRSRDAFFCALALASHCTKAFASKNKGRRSADWRNGSLRTGTSDERIRVRGQCGARHEWSALPRPSACGRARLSALRRGTRRRFSGLGSASGCVYPEVRTAYAVQSLPVSELLAVRS